MLRCTAPPSCSGELPAVSMARFKMPDGWMLQAFSFALDPLPEQAQILARQFGGRRYACNWAVRQLKEGIEAYQFGLADPAAAQIIVEHRDRLAEFGTEHLQAAQLPVLHVTGEADAG